MQIGEYIKNICQDAKDASRVLSNTKTEKKNHVLKLMASEIKKSSKSLIAANEKDLKLAKSSGMQKSFVDRLKLDKKRITSMAVSISKIAQLQDPCGEISGMIKRPNGLIIGKMQVPIGVIGIIYESRPNVTSDCAALCIKSGNAVILKGGKESLNSNKAICEILKRCLKKADMPVASVQLVESTEREATYQLLKMNNYLDLIIPRGGEALIKAVSENSSVPVIKHYKGICHVYVDKTADLKKAVDICFNAKVQRPGVCNAMESMLVHSAIALQFLPEMARRFKNAGVEIRGCDETRQILKDNGVKKATDKDYSTEYLDLILSVKIVKNISEAIQHINTYGSSHSDAIVTEDYNQTLMFLKQVDSACVYANASTRFTDGYEFGMGAEIGISTDKIHARGPMALKELTIYKYIIFGTGQIRQ